MTLLVRNEADIVEANLDYHLAQGVDHVIVTDHGSSDETPDLLASYERRGTVTVLREEGDEHHQSIRVTRMARLALSEHRADWVFHNDADEFWWPLAGSLRDVFAAIPPEYGQIKVQRRNFLPVADDSEPFYSRLIYRERQSLNPSAGPLEPKVAHRPHPDVVLPPGNHWITGADLRPVPGDELLEIFHYPMRSYEQFERKVVQIGIGYEKLADRSPDVGRDQLKLLEMYRSGTLPRYWERALRDDAELDRELRDGTVVLDRRLETFMRRLGDATHATPRPDGPPTRAFVERSLRAHLALEATRERLRQREAEVTAELTRLEEARSRTAQELTRLRTPAGASLNLMRAMGGGQLLARFPRLRAMWHRIRSARLRAGPRRS